MLFLLLLFLLLLLHLLFQFVILLVFFLELLIESLLKPFKHKLYLLMVGFRFKEFLKYSYWVVWTSLHHSEPQKSLFLVFKNTIDSQNSHIFLLFFLIMSFFDHSPSFGHWWTPPLLKQVFKRRFLLWFFKFNWVIFNFKNWCMFSLLEMRRIEVFGKFPVVYPRCVLSWIELWLGFVDNVFNIVLAINNFFFKFLLWRNWLRGCNLFIFRDWSLRTKIDWKFLEVKFLWFIIRGHVNCIYLFLFF